MSLRLTCRCLLKYAPGMRNKLELRPAVMSKARKAAARWRMTVEAFVEKAIVAQADQAQPASRTARLPVSKRRAGLKAKLNFDKTADVLGFLDDRNAPS